MGFQVGNQRTRAGGRSGRGAGGGNLMSDINITPFVDVMLVLLIIFMVAAPMMTTGVDISLPKDASQPLELKTEPITITITRGNGIFVGADHASDANIIQMVQNASGNNKDIKILIRADEYTEYKNVIKIIAKLNSFGYKKVVLMTDSTVK